jgi:hypothetical protein
MIIVPQTPGKEESTLKCWEGEFSIGHEVCPIEKKR